MRSFLTFFVIALLGSFSLPFCQAEVTIEQQTGPRVVSAANYSATVAPDGCVTNISIEGEPFLKAGVDISRGSYFYFNGPLQLPEITQSDNNSIVAEGDLAKIEYEFSDDKMIWTLISKNEKPMVFFLVLDKSVQAMQDAKGKLHPGIAKFSGTEATWLREKASLNIKGSTRFWGPWHDHQIVEVAIPPQSTSKIEFHGQSISEKELEAIKTPTEPVEPEPEFALRTPMEYEVFQRDQLESGLIRINGSSRLNGDSIEYRLVGESEYGKVSDEWQPVSWLKSSHQFLGSLRVPAGGWYRLDLRVLKDGNVIHDHSVEKFGVGEVFVGAGQSNSTNCGQFKTKQTSNMVSSFGGDRWKIADDPQLGVADKTEGGSFWPAFGDRLYEQLQVPIGVATTGFGGTSVNQWQPDESLFKWMMTRIGQLGPHGFRAVLWHQGESDVHLASDEYYRKLTNVIRSSKETAGWEFPWYVAQVSYHNPNEPTFDSTRTAQQRIWDEGIALQGPDTDTLTGDHRDMDGKGIHFSPKGLKAHGEMWADAVLPLVVEATGQQSKELTEAR